MSNTKDMDTDADVSKSIASLLAVQNVALETLRRMVARVEASQAPRASSAGDAESSEPS